MKLLLTSLLFILFGMSTNMKVPVGKKIFDVHLHGSADIPEQISRLKKAGIYKAAISSSWDQQELYRKNTSIRFLNGLMFPCPNGKVPYSLQPCFSDNKEWPDLYWVESQIKKGNIHFIGELLTQYYGISPSDSSLYPYYRLAQKYQIPVGIHTGGAGPNHGSPNFSWELGNPALLRKLLTDFPNLKIWIMHGGDQYFREAIELMKANPQVYADISVLCNPEIVPADRFTSTMQAFLDAGLENRLLFGSDNAPIEKAIHAVDGLLMLTDQQKQKIFFKNAEVFFSQPE